MTNDGQTSTPSMQAAALPSWTQLFESLHESIGPALTIIGLIAAGPVLSWLLQHRRHWRAAAEALGVQYEQRHRAHLLRGRVDDREIKRLHSCGRGASLSGHNAASSPRSATGIPVPGPDFGLHRAPDDPDCTRSIGTARKILLALESVLDAAQSLRNR